MLACSCRKTAQEDAKSRHEVRCMPASVSSPMGILPCRTRMACRACVTAVLSILYTFTHYCSGEHHLMHMPCRKP